METGRIGLRLSYNIIMARTNAIISLRQSQGKIEKRFKMEKIFYFIGKTVNDNYLLRCVTADKKLQLENFVSQRFDG